MSDTPAQPTTEKDRKAALARAKAFLSEPQFIAADKNLARCYLEFVRAEDERKKDMKALAKMLDVEI